MHSYSSIYDICFNFFLHMYTWIFSRDVCYLKFFHNCYLPDVASGVIVLLHITSLVPAICVVCEDDESNKVEFVLIDTHDEFTETLHCYAMTKHTFPCFLYHIYLSHVFLYMHVSVKYLSILLHMYT